MKKKQPGRPKTKDPRNNRVVVVFNEAEMNKLRKLSEGYWSISEYVRERTLG